MQLPVEVVRDGGIKSRKCIEFILNGMDIWLERRHCVQLLVEFVRYRVIK